MNSSTLPYWLILLVLVGASYGGWKWWQVRQFQSGGGIEFANLPPLEEFELTERNGQPFRSSDMRGKVWVTTFFYTSCPGACPRLNGNIKLLNSDEDLQDVVWVSISVDPEIDTLERLREYAESFQADPERWLFCRGELGYIQRVGEDIMKLPITWRGHNEHAIVIDRQGEVRGMYDATSTRQSKLLRKLLIECLDEPDVEVAAKAQEKSPEEAPANEAASDPASAAA